MKPQRSTSAMIALLLSVLVLMGQDRPLEVTVTGFTGLVRVRAGEEQPWQKVSVGMKLGPGAEFQTGPRSAVRFVIPPDQTITLDRLGVMKVLTAVQSAQGKITTNLGLKYGRTRYDIEEAGVEHASTIRTPSAQLAVRGTGVGFQEDFIGHAWCNQNAAYFTGYEQQEITFGEPSDLTDQTPDPGRKRMEDGTVDPNDPNSRQDNEKDLLIDRPDGNFDANQDGLMDFQKLLSSSDNQTTGQSSLQFQLVWNNSETSFTNDNASFYDLDIFLIAPDSDTKVLHTPNMDHLSSGLAIQNFVQGFEPGAQLFNTLDNGAFTHITDNGGLGSSVPIESGDGLRKEEILVPIGHPIGTYIVGVNIAAFLNGNDPTPGSVIYAMKVNRIFDGMAVGTLSTQTVDFITDNDVTAIHKFDVPASGAPTPITSPDAIISPPAER